MLMPTGRNRLMSTGVMRCRGGMWRGMFQTTAGGIMSG